MKLSNAIWYGGWAGASLGVAGSFALSSRNSDATFGDKLDRGVVAGAALGATAGAAMLLTPWKKVPAASLGAGKLAGRSALNHGAGMLERFQNLRKGGAGVLTSVMGGFGTFPLLAGAGAAIGATVDSDNRTRGAMIGAGVGVGAKLAFNSYHLGKSIKGMRKLGLAAGLSAIAYGATSHMMNNQPSAEAAYDDVDGYTENAPGTYAAGVKARMKAMKADGSVVFGSHSKRHG